MEGKTARGASSPAKPAFTSPEPLSHTRAVVSSSSHILAQLRRGLQMESGAAGAQCPRWRCPLAPQEGPEQGRRDRGGGGSACRLPSPRGRRGGVGRGCGDRGGRAWRRGEGLCPGVTLCSGCKDVPSPLRKSSPALHSFAFPHTESPTGAPPTPPAKPQLEGNAHGSRDPKCPGRGAAGLAICAPLFCHHPGPNK